MPTLPSKGSRCTVYEVVMLFNSFATGKKLAGKITTRIFNFITSGFQVLVVMYKNIY